MIQRNTILDFLMQIMTTWGFTMLVLFLFCTIFGENAYGYSSIFQLGNTGISCSTAMQFLGITVLIVTLRWLLFSTIFFKRSGILFRIIVMLVCVIVLVGIFASAFQWFPVGQVKPWIMFFICFFVCAAGSITISLLRIKSDNKKLQSALEQLKNNINESADDETDCFLQ